ncbi:hypothetical protein [Cohnella rhizosphaerae]|uniref:Uncharacterized protein n=1 Tax=Cohnella rhizosphaerae TaxID=1457232 RepID=A0A9X4QVE8_9BACL|nr:hypothetical protein [Cohnella rhizosphaerae]MDG0812368.1 hypothetical protein [Cohnella rhizosphaerae]
MSSNSIKRTSALLMSVALLGAVVSGCGNGGGNEASSSPSGSSSASSPAGTETNTPQASAESGKKNQAGGHRDRQQSARSGPGRHQEGA